MIPYGSVRTSDFASASAAVGAGKLSTGQIEVRKIVVAASVMRQDVGQAALRRMSTARWIRWHLNMGHLELPCAKAIASLQICHSYQGLDGKPPECS